MEAPQDTLIRLTCSGRVCKRSWPKTELMLAAAAGGGDAEDAADASAAAAAAIAAASPSDMLGLVSAPADGVVLLASSESDWKCLALASLALALFGALVHFVVVFFLCLFLGGKGGREARGCAERRQF